jgi:hypothetical protein
MESEKQHGASTGAQVTLAFLKVPAESPSTMTTRTVLAFELQARAKGPPAMRKNLFIGATPDFRQGGGSDQDEDLYVWMSGDLL